MLRYWVGRAADTLGRALICFADIQAGIGWWLFAHGIEAPVEHEPIGYAELVKPLYRPAVGGLNDFYTPAPDYLESMGSYRKGDC